MSTSTLALLVLLVAMMACLAVIVGAGYLVYRHPRLNAPLLASLTTAAVLVALFVGVVQAGPR